MVKCGLDFARYRSADSEHARYSGASDFVSHGLGED